MQVLALYFPPPKKAFPIMCNTLLLKILGAHKSASKWHHIRVPVVILTCSVMHRLPFPPEMTIPVHKELVKTTRGALRLRPMFHFIVSSSPF